MIQRPQTAYLLIATLLNLSVFFSPVYSSAINDPSTWMGYTFTIALVLATIIAFSAIFLFKNRILQLRVAKYAVYAEAAVMGIAGGIVVSAGGIGRHILGDVLGAVLIVLSLALLWLAARQIKKDEDLVRSMDRIR